MSNTMTAHEPINYLDSILNEEEKRCEYSHQWRNFTISRSGRFKSKNKHRNAVDGKMFDHTTATTSSSSSATAVSTTSSYNTSSSADKDKVSRLKNCLFVAIMRQKLQFKISIIVITSNSFDIFTLTTFVNKDKVTLNIPDIKLVLSSETHLNR